MMRLIIYFFLLLAFSINSFAQQESHTLHGIVIDSLSKEPLAGASIRFSGNSIGTQSDLSGRFSLKIQKPNREDSLIVTYVGYKKYAEVLSNLDLGKGQRISLISQPTTLKEVVVRSKFWLKLYSPQELIEDYTKFVVIMEKAHTGLFDYMSEKEWMALRDSSIALCKRPMTHSEFYRLIAFHVAKVGNIHTRHGVTDWWYSQKQNIFPFNIRYFGDRMFVSESLVKDLDFPKGTEIFAINGRTPNEIRKMIWPFIPADGYNEKSKQVQLDDYFPWYISLFVEEAEDFTIRFKKLNGDEATITTAGLRDSFRHLSLQQIWKWKKPALELEIDDKLKTAYFRIEDSRVFKDSIQTYFQRITDHGIQNLIIDLRGGGGIREEEQTAELFSYLITEPRRICDSLIVKSNDYRLFDKDFTYKPYARSLNEIRKKYLDLLVDTHRGYFLWKNEPYLKTITPAKNQFGGTVYILTDARNYSASTDLTSSASRLDNVFVVGEETGGEYRSYVSGAMFGLTLPNSEIGVKVATWKSVLAIKEDPSNRGRGVKPDYPVSISLEDFIKGTDVVKEFTYNLIASKNKD
jgi:hypothetical protein